MIKAAPKLRFPEFTDEWQVKKLGGLFSYEQPTKYLVSSTDYADEYDTPVLTAGKTFVLGKTDESYGIFQEGLPITLFDDFTTASQWVDFPFKLKSSAAKILKAKDGYNPKIAHEILQKIKFKADDHQRYWISTYQNFDVKIPSKPEQEKIADFLTAVDERIAVSEKKLELLETYKRGVMQKIFSQQVRFKDENGKPYPDWEEKKLSDVLKERNTQTPISGEYPLMAFVAYKGVAPKGDRYNREFLVSDAKSKKYKQTQLGDFIYSSNNLETGSIGLNLYGSASISPVYSIFETKDGYSHQFLGAYLTRKKFIYQMVRYRQGVVYGQWRIHESEFLKIEETFPCTEEQQKIANFLTSLDEKITAEKSKLIATRQFKKALLQRMFV